MINVDAVIQSSLENVSNLPVTTARYLLEVVMNEDDPDEDDVKHIKAFADEFQRALDANYFMDLRYNILLFEVIKREVLHIAAPNEPDIAEQSDELQAALRQLTTAKLTVAALIKEAIAEKAVEHGFIKLEFLGRSKVCRNKEGVVDGSMFDGYIEQYCERVDPEGLHAIWTPEHGWKRTSKLPRRKS